MRKLLFTLLLVSVSLQAQIRFDSLGYGHALEKAKSTNQLLFLDAYSTWCEPCIEIEEYVFSDLEVGKFYNKNFINIRLDMEQYPGFNFAEKFMIDVYPSFLFLNGDGEIVHRGCGAMDANSFLGLGEVALSNDKNLLSYKRRYASGEKTTDFLMNYLALLEAVCLNAEGFAMDYLSSIPLEDLTSETNWAVLAAYDWDIYSREFQYLVENQADFEKMIDPKAVQDKIYDTYLSQYQEVYEAEELHGFGMRALLHAINQSSFKGLDTLKWMMNLHYAELTKDWSAYASYAIKYVEIVNPADPAELSELAWKFYLFVEDKSHLEKAIKWSKKAVDELPEPFVIDTYASLQYKLGNKKKAIELARKALELANELYEDTTHFEYQLRIFQGK